MGNIFVRKAKTTSEILEQLDSSINDAEEYQKTTQLSQKRYVGYLMIFSGLIYLTTAFVGYFYYYPKDFTEVLIRLVPLFLFPFMIYGLKSAGCWWFVLRLEANEQSLEKKKRKRREILEKVKDKEIYNVAKEILDKFDPQLQLERLQRERKLEEEKQKELMLRHRTSGRRRRSLEPIYRREDGTLLSPVEGSAGSENGERSEGDTVVHQTSGGMPPPLPLRLPRPILPRDRSALDKMVDYLLGDGPNNRYALICGTCLAHNGMALKDDFEYVAYRCAYCGVFNPSKKQRLKVPNVHESSLSAGSSSASAKTFVPTSTEHQLLIDSLRGAPSEKFTAQSKHMSSPRKVFSDQLEVNKTSISPEESACVMSQSETFESLNGDELEQRNIEDDDSSASSS